MKLTNNNYTSLEAIRAGIQRHEFPWCVILGNGSSINDLDLDRVASFFTIGINRIGRAFTPDVHVSVDMPACISASPAKVSWQGYEDPIYIRLPGVNKIPSVPLACHIAMKLGFRILYLCGADYKGNYFWGADPRKERGNHLYYRSIIKAQLTHIHSISESLIHKGGQMFNCSNDTEIEFLEYSGVLNA